MEDNQKVFTNNYLQFCYTCLDAHQCDTTSKCVACWKENGIPVKDDEKAETTEELLKIYAL